MGCFSACFGSSRDAKRVKHPHKPPIQRNRIPKPGQSYLHTLQDDSCEAGVFNNVPFDRRNKWEVPLTISRVEEVTLDSNVLVRKEERKGDGDGEHEEETLEKASKIQSKSSSQDEVFAVPRSLGSYPPSHRYRNCTDSDDEEDVFDNSTDNYLATDENDKVGCNNVFTDDEYGMEESQRKVSAVGMFTEEDHSSMPVYGLSDMELNPSGLKPNATSKTAHMNPVLNPVENLSQWNAVKLKGAFPPTPQKENLKPEQDSSTLHTPESAVQNNAFSFEPKMDQPKKSNKEMTVDASLSNWLVSLETTPVSKTCTPVRNRSNSLRSQEDRPISGALTVEEFKQLFRSNSPRKSPSQSLDEKPIFGTVGTNWSRTVTDKERNSASSFKGIPNTTSKYREDKTVNWHFTPFETRLERALNRGISEA